MKVWPHPIKAVIFDNDGTLMDTEWVYSLAHKQLVGEEMEWPFKVRCMGKTALEAATLTCDEFHLSMTPEEFVSRRNDLVREYWPTIPLLPGAEALVKALKAKGIRQAIATASNTVSFEQKTSGHRDLISMIDHHVCGDEVERGKPEPDLFLAALAKWPGIAPENALVFEDAPLGILAANRAGMASVFVPDAHINVAQALAEHNAKPCATVKSLEEFSLDMFDWAE
jgi:pseudouridine-5'-monophosphatase